MVNSWLRTLSVVQRNFAAQRRAGSGCAQFRHIGCINRVHTRPEASQEVVLVRPIHGLLRMRGGSFCRKGLRVRSQASFAASNQSVASEGLDRGAICRGLSMLVPFIFAFLAVLALIGVAAWLVRRFASSRLGASTNRGRMPRLAVIDAAAVDGRRRLVLVRRDNVEHLLMIGGPTDIVVEPNIVRAMPGRDQLPPRPAVASPEAQPRIAPIPEPGGWADAEAARA